MAASTQCNAPCFSTSDADCPAGSKCFGYTGCQKKLSATLPPTASPAASPTASPTLPPIPSPPPSATPVIPPSPVPTAQPAPTEPPDPTRAPSGSPIVRPRLVAAPTFDGPGGTVLAASQRCYGAIFEVQTTPDAPAVRLANLEFYSPLAGANVAYEVWSRAGTWRGVMGQTREFTRLAYGNVTTSSQERGLTRLPRWQGGPARLDGGGARLALYLTLTTPGLLYARSTDADAEELEAVDSLAEAEERPTEDTVVLARTPELIVYEGAAITTYPFSKASERLFYRMPRGFVGQIWYHRAPCEDVITTTADGNVTVSTVTRWEDCGTARPPERLPNQVAALPGAFLAAMEPASSLNATPSASPAISFARVNLVMALANAGWGGLMGAEELAAFEATALRFYEGRELLVVNEVEIAGARVAFQQLLRPEEEEGGDTAGRARERTLGGRRMPEEGRAARRRALQEAATGSAYEPDPPETAATPYFVPSLEVTLVISILYSPLPQRITQELLRTMLANDSNAFLLALRNNVSPALRNYFQTVDAMPSLVAVEKVTTSPTPAPSAAPTPLVTEVVVEKPTIPPSTYASIVSGVFYGLLAAVGLAMIVNFRRFMRAEYQERDSASGIADAGAVLAGMRRGEDVDGTPGAGETERRLLLRTSMPKSMKLAKQGSIFNMWTGGNMPAKPGFHDDHFSDEESDEDGNDSDDSEEVSSIEDSSYSEEEDSGKSKEDDDETSEEELSEEEDSDERSSEEEDSYQRSSEEEGSDQRSSEAEHSDQGSSEAEYSNERSSQEEYSDDSEDYSRGSSIV